MASEDAHSRALKSFWTDADPEISDQARAILTEYSGIAEDQLIPHIREVRERAWTVFQYPCIGLYAFLGFGITKNEQYPEVLQRVKNGETLLDLACCFGQDIRKLVYDGAPAENLAGSELEQDFLDRGYELFRDKQKLKTKFTSGDFFAPQTAGLHEHSFDMVHAAAFFHLFSWPEQIEAVSKALRLLKPKSGSMLFGRQTCVDEAGELKISVARSGLMYRHNMESFEKLVEEVAARTGFKLHTKVEVDDKEMGKVGGAWKMMNFCITMQ